MTDAELRVLVREAVARRLAAGTPQRVLPPQLALAQPEHVRLDAGQAWAGHASHQLYLSLVNTTDACVIEPAVPCDHCGYCRSHGH